MACGSKALTSIPRIAVRVASTSSNRLINSATRSSDRFRPALAASLFRSSRLDPLDGSGIRLLHRIVGNGGIIGTPSCVPAIRIRRGCVGRFRETLSGLTSDHGSSDLPRPIFRAPCQTGKFLSMAELSTPRRPDRGASARLLWAAACQSSLAACGPPMM